MSQKIRQLTLDVAVRLFGRYATYRLTAKTQIPAYYADPRRHAAAKKYIKEHPGLWNDKHEMTVMEPFSLAGGKLRTQVIQWERAPNSAMAPDNWAAKIIMVAWKNVAQQPHHLPQITKDYREPFYGPRPRFEVTREKALKMYPNMPHRERVDE